MFDDYHVYTEKNAKAETSGCIITVEIPCISMHPGAKR